MIIGHFIKSVRIKKTLADLLLSPDLEKRKSICDCDPSKSSKSVAPSFSQLALAAFQVIAFLMPLHPGLQ